MSIIDNYGDFDLPEEKSVVEVVEDPVKTVLSCYDIFKKISEKTIKKKLYPLWNHDINCVYRIYEEGLKVFNGKEELKIDYKQTKDMLKELKSKAGDRDETGVFLSVLINSTKINALFIDEFPRLDSIGYRLLENKIIILGPKNDFFDLGWSAESGITINKGAGVYQCLWADGGVHINLGKLDVQGSGEGGIRINKGILKNRSLGKKDDLFINQGSINYIGCFVSGGCHINLTESQYFPKSVINLLQTKNKLKSQLEQKLSKLNFLKTEDPEKLVQLAVAYDWKKFEKELKEICEKIEEKYGKNNF